MAGEVRFYPLIENPLSGSCVSRALDLTKRAKELPRAVLVIELTQVGGDLLANEMAPRVHNFGHWTIEGAEVSQFENHLRAILGLPLGATSVVQSSV